VLFAVLTLKSKEDLRMLIIALIAEIGILGLTVCRPAPIR
jgi:hypothetical protein